MAGLRDRSVLPAVAAVIARSPLVLTVLTAFGAAYLLWLGITTVIRPPAPGAAADRASQSWVRRAAKGAGVSGLNPKAVLRRRLHQRGRHRRAGTAGPARRRHGGDPVLGSRDDRYRHPPAHRAPAHLAANQVYGRTQVCRVGR
jgi:hypothetical protein